MSAMQWQNNGGRPQLVKSMPPVRQARPRPIEYLTVAECAAILRVSKMTIYRAIHADDLRALRVGRQMRVIREDFDRYVRGAEVILEHDA